MGVVVSEDSFFQGSGVGEEDVHGIEKNAADVQAAAKFAEAFAKGESEASGLVVLEIVEAGVSAGKTNEFVEKEMERGRKAVEEFDFSIEHAKAKLVFALRWSGRIGFEEKTDVIEDDPGEFQPSGMVGIKFDFAVTVMTEEGFEVKREIAEGREKLLLDDFAGRVIAKELEKSGSGTNFPGEREQFGVDQTGLGFAEGEKRIVKARGVRWADGEDEEMVEEAMEKRLCDGNGDVWLEIVGAEFADIFDKVPEIGERLGFEGMSHELADADEIVVEVA